jgi:hypothetical protein
MRSSFLLIVVAFSQGATEAFSQSFYAIRKERSVIGYAGIGTANYFGELTRPNKFIDPPKYSINVGLEHFLTNRISARAEATWFQISGTDVGIESHAARNLSFVSNNIEANLSGTVNLFPMGRRFYQRPAINFYAFAGIGFVYINPKTEYNGEMVALQPLQTEGVKYSKIQPIIPFGAGVKFKVGPFFNVAVEGGIRKTFTDYLDDVSRHDYPDPATLSSDLARALSNRSTGPVALRGVPETKDWYLLATAKLQYYLPYDLSSIRRNKLYTQKRKYNRRR